MKLIIYNIFYYRYLRNNQISENKKNEIKKHLKIKNLNI